MWEMTKNMEVLATIMTILIKLLKSVIITPLTFLAACQLTSAAVGLLRRPSPDEEPGEEEEEEEEEDETDAAAAETISLINASNYVLIMEGAVPSLVHVNILKRRLKQRIPVVVVARRHGAAEGEDNDDAAVCAVCLNGLEEGEEVKELSNCRHVFHRNCIDCWMDASHFTCPFCRSLIFSNQIPPNLVPFK